MPALEGGNYPVTPITGLYRNRDSDGADVISVVQEPLVNLPVGGLQPIFTPTEVEIKIRDGKVIDAAKIVPERVEDYTGVFWIRMRVPLEVTKEFVAEVSGLLENGKPGPWGQTYLRIRTPEE